MNCNIIQQKGSEIISDNSRNLVDLNEEDFNNSLWVEINSSDREETVSQLANLRFNDETIEILHNPGKYFRIQLVGDSVIIDIDIGSNNTDSHSRFLTLYGDPNKTITIVPDGVSFYPRIANLLQTLGKKQKITRQNIVFNLLDKVLDDDVSYSRDLIVQIDKYAKETIGKVFSVNVEELEILKNRVVEFEEVIENQYTTVALLPEIDFTRDPIALTAYVDRFIKGIEHHQKMLERAEDKLDYFFQKYQSDLQERTNQKLNTLTIVQAIFVPLTFIAGIYGMNFVNMPELSWHSGYFYALGLMAFVVVFELYIFYRNGWFK